MIRMGDSDTSSWPGFRLTAAKCQRGGEGNSPGRHEPLETARCVHFPKEQRAHQVTGDIASGQGRSGVIPLATRRAALIHSHPQDKGFLIVWSKQILKSVCVSNFLDPSANKRWNKRHGSLCHFTVCTVEPSVCCLYGRVSKGIYLLSEKRRGTSAWHFNVPRK